MSSVERAIKADLSVDQAYRHMTYLVEEVGERLAGTESIARAATYIRQQLESYGLEARIDRFPIYHSYPGSAALRVVSPEDRVIEALPSCHIPSTLDEGLSGQLVYVGAGGYEDYEGVEAQDKIVLADMTWAPPRPEKARIALEKGAKALIIMNWGTPDNPVIQRGAIKSVWGNPTPESFKRIPRIPAIIGTSVPDSRSAPEIKDFLLGVVRETWGDEGRWRMPYKGGDQSFFGVGVPYVSFATGYTPQELERLNWASLSPWLHSEADTLDKIDKELYDRHLGFFASLVLRLCNSSLIPYDLSEPVRLLRAHLDALKELAQGLTSVDLKGLIGQAERLESAVERLNGYREKVLSSQAGMTEEAVRLINEASIKVSRELSPLWTEAGRYDQDPYGYHLIGQPIPRLYVPVVRMKELGEAHEAFNLWATKFTRERNRVSDIIGNAMYCLWWTMRLLEAI